MRESLNVRLIRKNLGWSQYELAKYLGVNRSTVSRIENRQSCSGSVYRLLEMLSPSGISRPLCGVGGGGGDCVDCSGSDADGGSGGGVVCGGDMSEEG